MAMITHTAPVARTSKVRTSHLSHMLAYTVFAAASGFMLAVVFGFLP